MRQAPVRIVAGVGGSGTAPSLETSNGVFAAPRLYGSAGIRPSDLSFAQLYDPFTFICMLHMEDFGLDYAATLRHWRANIERDPERLAALGYDERFRRMWRMYLCYCEAGFIERRIGVPVLFGWAKPVPVDFNKLKDPKRDAMKVALAGPAMNLALAVAAFGVMAALSPVHALAGVAALLGTLAKINVALAVFNMLPLPPLDGGHAAMAVYERARSRDGRRYQADATKLLPLTYAVSLMQGIWNGETWFAHLGDIAALATLAGIFVALSARVFRWE